MVKRDIFKIENYRSRKIQISVALEEDADGKVVFTIREGEGSNVVYDAVTGGWTDEEMKIFEVL